MKLTKLTSVLPSLLAATLLAACSGTLMESKKIEYKSAAGAKLPTLEIPPDLTQPSSDERYAVPDTSPKGSATFSAYSSERGTKVAPGLQGILPQVDKMRVERAGTQRWLVVPGTAEQLWPNIKDFWAETGFLINVELPEAGIIETDWAENRAKLPQDVLRNTLGKVFDSAYSTPERDKFRTRLEKSAEPGMVEIYISHRGLYEIYINEGKSETKWQPRPADVELEAEMLRRLMVRLGTDEIRAATLVDKAAAPQRAKLTRASDGAGTLIVEESFDRAWRRVGLALDRVGFTVEDRDRTQGLYYVRYIDPDVDAAGKGSEGGFFSKLAFWRSNDSKDGRPASDIQYRINVKGEGNNSVVQVVTREGGVDKSDAARKILGLLNDQLK
ncbi:MAG: outer membrane protein assembly factor BamC [Rhodocyclaceae bacterium]|nr:outer membrane protein assembly factor BamC [Rhodocyclaceae bacterium]